MNVNKQRKESGHAMVVAQLVQRLLPIPEVCCSNPLIGKVFIEHCLLSTVLKRRKERKRGRESHLLKNKGTIFFSNLNTGDVFVSFLDLLESLHAHPFGQPLLPHTLSFEE